ncbi:Alkylated DNA repair protein alkB-like protein [Zostera marina]|uniref:Alkylated DNA repair protein alkB-like protein n=1 Tax=Zostera marina TaxID=29655 RepID=A0A0K9PRJ4_ZOSMR|nr:Alkylated DNA repair protein alkB-like protein [Zostera marina]
MLFNCNIDNPILISSLNLEQLSVSIYLYQTTYLIFQTFVSCYSLMNLFSLIPFEITRSVEGFYVRPTNQSMEARGSGDAEGEFNLENYKVGNLPTVFYIPDFITDSEQTLLLRNIYEVPSSKWKSLKNRRLQNWGGVVHEKGLLPLAIPSWLTRITEEICEKTNLFPSPINHVLINEYLPDQGIMPHQDGPAYFPVVAIISLGSPVVIDFSPHLSLNESSRNTDPCMVHDPLFDEKTATILDENSELLESFSLVLNPRSLLIFKDHAYSDFLHGIKDSSTHKLNKVLNAPCKLQEHPIPNPCSTTNKCDTSKGTEEEKVEKEEKSELLHRTCPRVSLTCRLVLKVRRNIFKF